jgi:Domain of unknown function (DUF4136)
MKAFDVAILSVALLALAGCATTPHVHSRGDSSTQFGSSETFALLSVTVDPNLPSATASVVAEAAETGARDTLRALGYSETSREVADLVFYVHGKSMTPVEVSSLDFVPEPARFGLSPAKMTDYANRLIVVETYDNHSKRQVWMGWLECSCRGINPERIQHEIQRIVATFPPRTKSISRS